MFKESLIHAAKLGASFLGIKPAFELSDAGLDFIKSYETLSLKAYKAVPTEKYLTIGYGHYSSDIKAGDTITEAEALELLRQDIQTTENGINKAIKAVRQYISQNQFDALISLSFNIGLGNFQNSTLLKKLLKKDFAGASEQFLVWRKSGGKVLAGLEKRRQAEKLIFDKGIYNNEH
jgi:GH24 family phage-related lysozyme (muramidase)